MGFAASSEKLMWCFFSPLLTLYSLTDSFHSGRGLLRSKFVESFNLNSGDGLSPSGNGKIESSEKIFNHAPLPTFLGTNSFLFFF